MIATKFYCGECHKVISISNKRRHEQRCFKRSVIERLYGK